MNQAVHYYLFIIQCNLIRVLKEVVPLLIWLEWLLYQQETLVWESFLEFVLCTPSN